MLKFTINDKLGDTITEPFGKTQGQALDLKIALERAFEAMIEGESEKDKLIAEGSFTQFLQHFIDSGKMAELGWKLHSANEFFVFGMVFQRFFMNTKKEMCSTKNMGGIVDRLLKDLKKDIDKEISTLDEDDKKEKEEKVDTTTNDSPETTTSN